MSPKGRHNKSSGGDYTGSFHHFGNSHNIAGADTADPITRGFADVGPAKVRLEPSVVMSMLAAISRNRAMNAIDNTGKNVVIGSLLGTVNDGVLRITDSFMETLIWKSPTQNQDNNDMTESVGTSPSSPERLTSETFPNLPQFEIDTAVHKSILDMNRRHANNHGGQLVGIMVNTFDKAVLNQVHKTVIKSIWKPSKGLFQPVILMIDPYTNHIHERLKMRIVQRGTISGIFLDCPTRLNVGETDRKIINTLLSIRDAGEPHEANQASAYQDALVR